MSTATKVSYTTHSSGFSGHYVNGYRSLMLQYNTHTCMHTYIHIHEYTHYLGFRLNYGDHYHSIKYTDSSDFHSNYVNECALPARVAMVLTVTT
jgi:hypothetical protein